MFIAHFRHVCRERCPQRSARFFGLNGRKTLKMAVCITKISPSRSDFRSERRGRRSLRRKCNRPINWTLQSFSILHSRFPPASAAQLLPYFVDLSAAAAAPSPGRQRLHIHSPPGPPTQYRPNRPPRRTIHTIYYPRNIHPHSQYLNSCLSVHRTNKQLTIEN